MRARLRADGYSDHELRRMLRSGELSAVRPGAYLAGAPPDDLAARHLLAVHAAVAALSPDTVVSHVSAAVVHGLPVWGVPLEIVHVTRVRRRSGGRRGARVHVHSAPLDPDEIVVVGGTAVTSAARTLADLARQFGFESAVVTADAALHRHLVDRAGLDAAVARYPRWPGLPAARRALAFADARALNPGESRSRVAIARAGLPAPVPQWVVRTADGVFVGEVDFGWPTLRTVGEFDGQVKYGRGLRSGQDPVEVLYAEKVREDALRSEDLGMVRWGWTDLGGRFTPVAQRLRDRFRPL